MNPFQLCHKKLDVIVSVMYAQSPRKVEKALARVIHIFPYHYNR